MDVSIAISAMSALAQPTRMRVVAALKDRFPSGMSVGDLAKAVETPPNTMSSHLAILSRAGLVVAQRLGRVIEYRADPTAIRELADFILSQSPTKQR